MTRVRQLSACYSCPTNSLYSIRLVSVRMWRSSFFTKDPTNLLGVCSLLRAFGKTPCMRKYGSLIRVIGRKMQGFIMRSRKPIGKTSFWKKSSKPRCRRILKGSLPLNMSTRSSQFRGKWVCGYTKFVFVLAHPVDSEVWSCTVPQVSSFFRIFFSLLVLTNL